MDKYQRGKIYTIRCHNDDTMIYVGSTIETLAQRMAKHRCDSKREGKDNTLLYQTVNGDWGEWYVELFENYPCNSKEELCKREGEVMREISNLNIRIEGRTRKEWCNDNREKLIKHRKEYYENNKATVLEKCKEYRDGNKPKIAEYHKVYYENNVEKLAEYKKIYNENNKQKIAEQNAQIVVCQYCGCKSTKHSLPRHQRTAKCMKAREST